MTGINMLIHGGKIDPIVRQVSSLLLAKSRVTILDVEGLSFGFDFMSGIITISPALLASMKFTFIPIKIHRVLSPGISA